MISYYYAINFHLGFPSLSVSGLKYLLNSWIFSYPALGGD